MAAPWILGFSAFAGALYTHLVVGLVAVVLGAVALWYFGNRSLSAA